MHLFSSIDLRSSQPLDDKNLSCQGKETKRGKGRKIIIIVSCELLKQERQRAKEEFSQQEKKDNSKKRLGTHIQAIIGTYIEKKPNNHLKYCTGIYCCIVHCLLQLCTTTTGRNFHDKLWAHISRYISYCFKRKYRGKKLQKFPYGFVQFRIAIVLYFPADNQHENQILLVI